MEELGLRPARPDDEELLFRLHREALGPYVAVIWGWDDDFQREMFRRHFDPGLDQVVGWGPEDIGRLRVEDGGDSLYIDYVALLPGWQGRGIGTALVERVKERAAAACLPVRLSVLRPNPARNLYERLGFHVTDEDEIRIRMQWGAGVEGRTS